MDIFTDTKPQIFLDEYHKANVPRIFVPQLSQQQRNNLINLSRKKVTETRMRVQQQIKAIRARYDESEADEAKRGTAPYRILDDLGKQLLEEIDAVEKVAREGRRLPKGFGFGHVIFGVEETGEWHLGEMEDSERFEQLLNKRSRLAQLKADRAPLQKQIKKVNGLIDRKRREVDEVTEMYQKLKPGKVLAIRLMGVFSVALLCAALAAVAFLTDRVLLGAAAAGLVIIFLLLAIIVYKRRRNRLNMLRKAIQLGRTELKKLRKEQLRLRNTYIPLDDLCKQLAVEIKELQATFA